MMDVYGSVHGWVGVVECIREKLHNKCMYNTAYTVHMVHMVYNVHPM